jgi:hypothetical protein
MTRDVEYFFMCFLVICTLSFEKFLFSHLPISSLGHWFFWSLVFRAPYKFWLLHLLLDVKLAKIFFHYMNCLFSLVTASLLWRSFLVSCSPNLSVLSVSYWTTGVLIRNLLPMPICSSIYPILSCKSLNECLRPYIKVSDSLWIGICTGWI